VTAHGAIGGLGTSVATVWGDEVGFVGVLESIEGGVCAEGVVTAHWRAECRRCLEPVEGTLRAEVREVFEAHPTEGETYPLASEELDLEPMVRDAVLLGLPLAPLCRQACAGPAPESFPTVVPGAEVPDEAARRPRDPRWAALDELRFE
jgi:uncharacterized protein